MLIRNCCVLPHFFNSMSILSENKKTGFLQLRWIDASKGRSYQPDFMVDGQQIIHKENCIIDNNHNTSRLSLINM
jgi:hypothetical protein